MSEQNLQISVGNSFGAGFLGAVVMAMLYGVTSLQTYFYFNKYTLDSLRQKLLVSSIWFLDTFHILLVIYFMYHYLVTSYGNPENQLLGHWTLYVSILTNITVSCTVQCFFTLRVFYLCSGNWRWIVTTVIGISVLAHLAFGLETTILMFMSDKLIGDKGKKTLTAMIPFGVFVTLSDVLIATALCVLLHGSRTRSKQTNGLLKSLMIYAINRCILTSLVAIAEVVMFAVFPQSMWFIAIDFVVGELYANSLLAHLNSRQAMRMRNRSLVNSLHLSNITFQTQPSGQAENHVFDLQPELALSRSSNTSNTPPTPTEEQEEKNSNGLEDSPKINP